MVVVNDVEPIFSAGLNFVARTGDVLTICDLAGLLYCKGGAFYPCAQRGGAGAQYLLRVGCSRESNAADAGDQVDLPSPSPFFFLCDKNLKALRFFRHHVRHDLRCFHCRSSRMCVPWTLRNLGSLRQRGPAQLTPPSQGRSTMSGHRTGTVFS